MSFRPPSPHPRDHDPVSHAQLNDRLSYYVTGPELTRRLAHIDRHIQAIEENITIERGMIVSAQDDINAAAQRLADLKAKVESDDSALNAAVVNIQAWINSQPASVDTSGLAAEVDALSGAVDANAADIAAAAALVPAPPAGG